MCIYLQTKSRDISQGHHLPAHGLPGRPHLPVQGRGRLPEEEGHPQVGGRAQAGGRKENEGRRRGKEEEK